MEQNRTIRRLEGVFNGIMSRLEKISKYLNFEVEASTDKNGFIILFYHKEEDINFIQIALKFVVDEIIFNFLTPIARYYDNENRILSERLAASKEMIDFCSELGYALKIDPEYNLITIGGYVYLPYDGLAAIEQAMLLISKILAERYYISRKFNDEIERMKNSSLN